MTDVPNERASATMRSCTACKQHVYISQAYDSRHGDLFERSGVHQL